MNKKRKTLFVALLSIFTTAGLLAACNPGKDITEIPADKDYGFTNPTVSHMAPDAGYTIDGVLDEKAYKDATWIYLHNDNGTSTVDLAMTSRYGEKGMYFAYDVTENTPIYVNHDRASYINSGIETYFAPNGVTSMSSENIFEIDLEADGTLTFKRNNGKYGWENVATTSDIMAYLASQPKGGEVNTEECYGYTLEFFIPWDYLSWLGLNVETIKEEAVYVNPVHITSYNYEGTDHNRDRYWYSFATQLGGDGWGNVSQYFKFGADGAVGTVPITLGEGVHCKLSGPTAVMPGLPATVTVTPDSGYAITSFKCDGAECVKLIDYNKDGSATYTVYGADAEITFSAEAEAVTAGNKTLSGKINLRKAGGDTFDGMVASYFDADGEHDLEVDANGAFTLAELAQGYYTIQVKKQGYGTVTRGIYLNRDVEIQIDFEFAAFDSVEGTCWETLNANDGYVIKKSGRGAILSKNSYDTFYAEANFRYDEALASKANADEYYQQRTGFRIKFSGGKYWHPDIMCEAGSFKVTFGKILNDDSIFNWDTVHTMNAKQIAKYKSADGIKLGVLRVGTTAYIYLDGELVATTNLGAQGIKADETAQIGFEGYVYNDEPWRIDYSFKDKNPNGVVLNSVNSVGGSVEFDDSYKVGEDVILVLGKDNPTDVLLSLIVNGEELSNYVITESDGVQTLTLTENRQLTLDITVVYGAAGEVTANIIFDSAWKANGITFTLTNKEDPTAVYTATVANDKMTVENMKKGLYGVTATVFGAEVDLGWYSVVSGEDKLLEVENVFVNGKALDVSVIDLSNGSFVYHSAIDEDYSVKLNAEKGDAYLAAKISLTAQDKATLLRGGEVSFGTYMTVEGDDGNQTTHWVDFWIKNAGNDNFLSLRTDFGWDEKICESFADQAESNKFAKALFGDGLYVVLRYNAEKGVMETYFGDRDYTVAYLRDWNDASNLFPANGKVTALGLRDNLTWGGTPVTLTVEGFRYGRTLTEALGVAGKTIEVNGDGQKENGEIHVPATQCGGDVTITLNPANGYKVASLTVNGEAVPVSEIIGGRTHTIRNYMGAALTVDATFVKMINSSVDAAISGKKLGSAASLAGKTVTLSGNGSSDVTATVTNDGKLVIASIAAGTWNLSVEGCLPTTITVAEDAAYETAIVLECDTFKEILGWGKFDFTNQNFDTPEFGITNDCAVILTNDTYAGDVMASIYLKGDNMKAGNGGLVFRFVGEGMADNGESFTVVMQNTKKVQVSKDDLWGTTTIAEGVAWNNLIYFVEGEDDDEYRYADAHSQEYLDDYAEGKLKLSILRKESTFYVFLNGRYVGKHTIADKYKNARCEVGFITAQLGDATDWKYWNVDVTDDADNFPELTATVTDKTTDTNGTVTISKTEGVVGSDVTVKVEPNNGYIIGTVKVNGVDVTDKLSGGEYTFELKPDTVIVATFEEIVVGSINSEVVGKKVGVTGNSLSGDMQVVLASATAGTKQATLSTVEGKTVLKVGEIPAGKWTVKVEGYLTAEIEVAKNAEYTTAISLEYDLFEVVKWDASGHDFTHVNDAENPYIKWNGNGTSLNVVSKENMFDNATVSVTLKAESINDGWRQQGLILRFEDGKAAILNINTDGTPRLQFRPNLFDTLYTAFEKEWVEFKNVTAEEVTKYNSETGIELKVARSGCWLYAFIDDRFVGKAELPAKYENSKMGFGLFAFGALKDAEWKYSVSETLPSFTATVTVNANEEHGSVEVENADNIKLGDTVTVTVTPARGKFLESLKVGDTEVRVNLNGETGVATYELSVTDAEITLTATFIDAPVNEAEASVSGTELGNIAMEVNGKTITFKPESGPDVLFTVEDNKVKGILVPGSYKVSLEGCYDIQVTVGEDGAFENLDDGFKFEKIIFVTNGINEPTKNIFGENNPVVWSADSTHAASTGKIVSDKDGKIYEWSVEEYQDVAITVTLKSGNGNQGLVMRFGGQQKDVRLRFENNKAQWIGGDNGGWWWGTSCIHDRWDFGGGEDYANNMSAALLEKYNGADGLKLTLARKGGMVYALIDGKIYSAQSVSDFADKKVRLAVFAEGAKNGYSIPFVIEDTDDVLARAGVAAGTDVSGYMGNWTNEEGTLKVEGNRGYAEFNVSDVKESAKIHISKDNAGDQGLVYRFNDGKYIAVRYQKYTEGDAEKYKIQYTMDTILYNDGSLKGWTDFGIEGDDATDFVENGADLTFIRDGNAFYLMLNGKLLDKSTLDSKYSDMQGAMGVMIWNSQAVAFGYEHKTGNDVTVPAE